MIICNDTYDESEIVSIPNYFFNILCRLYMGARNVVILIAAYGLLVIKTHRKLLKIFLVTSLCFPVYMFTAYASRAVMIMTFFFLVFIFVFLSVFMNVGLKKKIVSYLILNLSFLFLQPLFLYPTLVLVILPLICFIGI